MPSIRLDHFRRAAVDAGAHGDNDMLPFGIDTRFVNDNEEALAELAFAYCQELAKLDKNAVKNSIVQGPHISPIAGFSLQ